MKRAFAIASLLIIPWLPSLALSPQGTHEDVTDGEPVGDFPDIFYNEVKGETNVGFSELQIYKTDGTSISLSLGCSYKGRVRSDPGQCFVGLTSRSPNQEFPDHDTPFAATADGKVATNKPFKSFGFEREGKLFVEPIFTLWTVQEMQALATGRDIVFKIGRRKIHLGEKQAEAIRFGAHHFDK